jgi:hypothetical protein
VFERGGKRHFRRRDHGIRHRGRIASGLAEAQLRSARAADIITSVSD